MELSILPAIHLAPASVNAFLFDAAKVFPWELATLLFSFSVWQLVMGILPPASVKLSFSLAMRMATLILPERAKFSSF